MTGLIRVSRSTKELLIKIKQIEEEYIKKGKEITIEILANKLNTSKEDIAFALESNKPIESIDEKIYNDKSSDRTKINQIKDEKDETNCLINRICLNKIIQELDKREQQIIILRYYKNKTQKEVAKIFKISQVQISRIEKKILLEMRNKICA